jgi:hypothetical protein
VSARLWLVADGLFAILFTLSVLVQFNDPDPLPWATIYGLAAIVSGLSAAGRARTWVALAVCAIAAAWALTLAPGVVGRVPFGSMFDAWEMKNAGIEESREMYGLLMVGAWMAAVAVRARRRSAQGA